MSSDLVLVTGASGYVASRCILRLIEDGYRVRGTLRSLRRADEVRGWLAKGLGGIDPGAPLSFVQAELGLPRLAYPIVDVRDLADLQIRAMTSPQAAGQRYIASAGFLSMKEIAAALRSGLGEQANKVPLRGLPNWVMRLVGLFDGEVRGQTFELGKIRKASSAKAQSQLGWTPRPVEHTVVDTATSLVSLQGSSIGG
jgi:nucleoside-diphosphate-sugar epimerase